MFYYTEYESPLGTLTTASDGAGVSGLWFAHHKYKHAALPEEPVRDESDPVLAQLSAWLDAYFAKKRPSLGELPLSPHGSDFRQVVWKVLRQIPYGETVSYGEVSQQVAAERGKASPRCVGGAVGHNPISIVVPCHRVVGANGNLTGFGGGIANKIALLEHEGVDLSRYSIPTKGTAI